MEPPVKRKIVRSDVRSRSPLRSEANTPTPHAPNIVVRAKISTASLAGSKTTGTAQVRSKSPALPAIRSRSPVRGALSYPSLLERTSPTQGPQLAHNNGSFPSLVPKAKKSVISISNRALSPVAAGGNGLKPALFPRNDFSGASPSPPPSTHLKSTRASGHRRGSLSDDGRSSNLSSNLSSNFSLNSAPSTPSSVASFADRNGRQIRGSATVGPTAGAQNGMTQGPIRVRAKISGLATPLTSSPVASPPVTAVNGRERSNSVTSASPKPPIVRAMTPGIHRRTSSGAFRVPPGPNTPSAASSPQSISPPRASSPHFASPRLRAHTILSFNDGPRSPVTSNLSLSSTSGASSSGASVRTSVDIVNGVRPQSDSLVARVSPIRSPQFGGSEELSAEDEELRDAALEAKSNRKIADLEITNKSLLAINASLEADKSRQSREIRDLRRRLRESRLILPPRTYKELVKASPEVPVLEESDEEEGDAQEPEPDPVYDHVRDLVGSLLLQAKEAIENVEKPPNGAAFKVLSAAEVETYEYGRKAEAEQAIRSNGVDPDADTDADEADNTEEEYEGDGMSLVMEVDEDDADAQSLDYSAEDYNDSFNRISNIPQPSFTLNVSDPDCSIDE